MNTVYRVSNESTTADDFLRGIPEVRNEVIICTICLILSSFSLFPEYLLSHQLFQEWEISPEKARLSSNFIDAGFKIRPTEEELKEMGPEFNKFFNEYFKNKPDKPVMFGSIVSGAYADHTMLPPGKYITMYVANYYSGTMDADVI